MNSHLTSIEQNSSSAELNRSIAAKVGNLSSSARRPPPNLLGGGLLAEDDKTEELEDGKN